MNTSRNPYIKLERELIRNCFEFFLDRNAVKGAKFLCSFFRFCFSQCLLYIFLKHGNVYVV